VPVSPEFRDFVLEQLEAFEPVSHRAMFGGYGLYARQVLFALLDDDVMYLRTDEAGRTAFESAGSRPFAPIPGAKPMLGYWETPAEVLEDRELLAEWSARAHAVAMAAKAAKARKTRKLAARRAAKKPAERASRRGAR